MTLVMVAVVAMAALLAAAVLAAGQAALASGRARGAADAAAFAAAYSLRDDRALGLSPTRVATDACVRAEEAARRWRATVTACRTSGGAVVVEVATRSIIGTVRATSRAGTR
jgi:hypothetical protein